jgi:UDP-N-acetyl-D-galactosamine dehydrogenase
MGLDTREILDAAGTKWNFLNFRPGLVGGHCIGVDPYYLTHKSQEFGYHPDMILAGRRINDNMGIHVAAEVVKLMVKRGISMPDARILIMGITFKENCPDVRNTRVIDLISELQTYGSQVEIYDPWAEIEAVADEYGISITNEIPDGGQYDAIVVAVAHKEFREMSPAEIHALGKPVHVVYDIKYVLPFEEVDGRL